MKWTAMKWLAIALGCVFCLLLAPRLAPAEDGPDANKPAKEVPAETAEQLAARARFEALRAKVPSPESADAYGLHARGYILLRGDHAGAFDLAIGPNRSNEKWIWHAHEGVDPAGQPRITQAMGFGPKLGSEEGSYSQGDQSLSWTFDGTKLHMRTPKGDGTWATSSLPRTKPFLGPLSSIVQFAGATRFAPGTYRADVFLPDTRSFAPAAWIVEPAKWEGSDAQVVEGTYNDASFRIVLSDLAPNLHECCLKRGASKIEYIAGDVPWTQFFEEAPKSDKQAAAQAAHAILVGRPDTFEKLIHWPTLFAAAKKANPKLTESLAAFRKRTLADAIAKFPERSKFAEAVAQRIKQRAASFHTSDNKEDGSMTVLLTIQDGLVVPFRVKKFDGRWYLVELPVAVR